jgi:hypothetical protein
VEKNATDAQMDIVRTDLLSQCFSLHLNSSASLNLIRASVARFGYDFFVTL